MTKESLEEKCLSKKGAVKEYPFDKVTAVYKVGNKMFALSSDVSEELRINIKCDPLYAAELRSIYLCVEPGYHMNKKHCNSVICNREADDKLVEEWIDDSYDLVFKALPKKLQNEISRKG
ncbi:MAG: MmcQ/YjbR family DNA-binding protein [Thiovulaceae bacterium]|nr:MmcQ/YjbR family DNA-binding protein [Sulfurimonadaceae bacterium]